MSDKKTKKKSGSSKKTANSGNSLLRIDIIFIGILVISALLFLSVIGSAGFLGKYIGNFLFGLFGIEAYIFPFFLAFISFCILISPYKKILSTFRLVLLILTFFLMNMFTQLLFSTEAKTPDSAFFMGFNDHVGGGFFGGCLSFLAIKTIGVIGAYLINIVGFIVILLLFTQKSVFEIMSNHKRKPRKPKAAHSIKDVLPHDKEKSEVLEKTEKSEKQEKYKEIENRLEDKFAEHNKEIDALIEIIGDENEVNTKDTDQSITIAPTEPPKPEKQDIRGIDFNAFAGETKFTTEPVTLKPIAPPVASSVSTVVLDPIDEGGSLSIDPVVSPKAESIDPKTITPDSIASESVVPDTPVPETIESASIAVDSIVPDTPVPETINPGAIESEFIVPDTPVPETIVPETIVPETIAPETIAPESIAPEAIVPETIAPENINPDSIATESIVPDAMIPESDSLNDQYIFPDLSLLVPAKPKVSTDDSSFNSIGDKLITTLKNFGVNASLSDISIGPTVTRYEIIPEVGTKVAKITNLSDDIKLNLAVDDIRIEAPIPGKAAVGIEVPNKEVVMVTLRELLESDKFKNSDSPMVFGAGKDIGGNTIISDIAKMPHVLIAGATGSGKSVCINTIIMSILFKARPDEIKFIMIDPKVVELNVYNSIPHLLIPVVSDPKKAAGALHWAVNEMNERYKKFASLNVRDLKGFNKKIMEVSPEEYEDAGVTLPRIIVIVDELADLMMVAKSEVEESICRLAQLARACGIHLVIATQRPSVDVITGLIKANMPSRIAFSVTSGVDSRTILDQNGAEKLLGKGDMLYFPQGLSKPVRVQGAFVSDDEVTRVVDFIREKNTLFKADKNMAGLIETAMEQASTKTATPLGSTDTVDDANDELFEAAGRFVIEKGEGSIGSLQRKFRVGFNRAARIMDQLEAEGVVGSAEGTKPRKVIISPEEFENILGNQ